jgi:hypothetical protein
MRIFSDMPAERQEIIQKGGRCHVLDRRPSL